MYSVTLYRTSKKYNFSNLKKVFLNFSISEISNNNDINIHKVYCLHDLSVLSSVDIVILFIFSPSTIASNVSKYT